MSEEGNQAIFHRNHRWGPVLLPDGKTRFELWAPVEQMVKLKIGQTNNPMTKLNDGWHVIDIAAGPGIPYQFVLSDGRQVCDPASRLQLGDLDGPSVLTDSNSYTWLNPGWRGRPWEQAVIYEIHIGAFTREGTYSAAIAKLPILVDLGITALEIMPLAHFPGTRGWGYDGVLQFAPHNAYGTPDDLKALIDAAHGHGMMVFLDVVYNHFGPQGNYLGKYAPDFFRSDSPTPWGAAIAYERPEVRAFFIQNALYWLGEFRLDGLRLDAIDQIKDSSEVHVLEEIANCVRDEINGRHVHLITENPTNGTDLMADAPGGRHYKADWNDDFHHSVHVAVTGESSGHYEPFKDDPWRKIKQTMASGYLKPGKPVLGDAPPPTDALPPTAFIHFLQNHDQIGNRALGDRLPIGINGKLYRALTEILLLSPQIPLLFMGDEHLSAKPFHFFADYHGEIAEAMRQNRPAEAANFGGIPAGKTEADIPDPNSWDTLLRSKLDWHDSESIGGLAWAEHIRHLLKVRSNHIIPMLADAKGYSGTVIGAPEKCLFIDWKLGSGTLKIRANLSDEDVQLGNDPGDAVYVADLFFDGVLRPFVVAVFVT
ncbi:malto-oligosyltrehalose trehalohydrolase [Rhizobium mesoamericanum]|uniref:Malto-oligosyltrehalose trehalohydrolase n=1 Tax=Rhizobium mesoamericanum STM3625 TaxID=1211777 RepID=K0Q5G1_9HYPH|nr:malto-oligosyltrehalose trehalohydrolase [Rhizobium mesoamericanum]CCM78484.1 Malto-oligosyltrehalose trehalohydrolase [Rhizobium mesoamericanum STM3625]